MTNYILPLVLGDVPIPPACGPIRQRYQPFGGSSELRMASGRGMKQSHWRKMQISSSGSGPLDPALTQLDYSKPLELWCIKTLSVCGSALNYELPLESARRPDVSPWAWAWANGSWLETALTMEGAIASVTAVPDAALYRVSWYPRYLVLTDGVVSDFDESRGQYDWSLEARER